jgi:hypothetical protein
MLRTKIGLQSGAKRQKCRLIYTPTSLPSLPRGEAGLFFQQAFRLDLVYLRLIRRAIKRTIRRYRGLSHSRRV